jgi:hypothetical protein
MKDKLKTVPDYLAKLLKIQADLIAALMNETNPTPIPTPIKRKEGARR